MFRILTICLLICACSCTQQEIREEESPSEEEFAEVMREFEKSIGEIDTEKFHRAMGPKGEITLGMTTEEFHRAMGRKPNGIVKSVPDYGTFTGETYIFRKRTVTYFFHDGVLKSWSGD